MAEQVDPQQFWAETEKEIGTPILINSMARITEPKTKTIWTLFYATGDYIYFRFFKNRSWLGSLMNRGSEGEDSVCAIPYSDIKSAGFLNEIKFLKIFNIREGLINFNFSSSKIIHSNLETQRIVIAPLTPVTNIRKNIEQFCN